MGYQWDGCLVTGIICVATSGGVTAAAMSATLTSTASWQYDSEIMGYVSDALTATPSGGTGPYSFSLELVSGSITNAGGAGTGSGATSVYAISLTGVATVVKVLVTDSLGQSAYTNNCSLS